MDFLNRHLLMLAALLFPLVSLASDYYTFTNSEGQTIKAKPLRFHGDRVEIERDDGVTFKVDPNLFIEKDRKYLGEWQKAQILKKGAVEVKATSSTTRKVKEDTPSTTVAHFKGFYKVELSNTSELDLKNLKVEYRFFIFDNKLAAERRSDGKLKRVAGEHKVPSLRAYDKIEFETKRADMKETKLKSGWYYTNGGDDDSKDELEGVWVRVYRDEDMIAEFSNPSNLPEKEDW